LGQVFLKVDNAQVEHFGK